MKNYKKLLAVLFIAAIFSCEKNEIYPANRYECSFNHIDISELHPKAAKYQKILDENRKLNIVGATMMVKDQHGIWTGSTGQADIASNVNVKSCNRFLIASISKVFTAAAIFKLVDDGTLSIEDPINKWLDDNLIDKVKNANESSIAHLLNHTSGIADYYTMQYELDRLNKVYNNWRDEDVLKYTYGKSPTNEVGETYYYSNTNYLLLGMIIEAASGQALSDAYQQLVFNPAELTSAYYGTTKPILDDVVKGYADVYGNGQFIESEFLYKDELNTADGGIAINAYDLGIFFEKLAKGTIVSEQSYNVMSDWFDLPEGWVDDVFGHYQNGMGLERNNTPFGSSIGHTGGIDGFLSIAQYFPEDDATFVLLTNSASYNSEGRENIYNETLEVMFED